MQEEKGSIHNILAHSYLAYFVFSMIGLFVDTFIGFDRYIKHSNTIAVICFALGSFLIMWAQYTSGRTYESTAPCPTPYFCRGPYRYMRNPTHLGIVLLVAGYTMVSGSVVFLSVTILGYLISNVFFKQYESRLDSTYGAQYEDYKKKVPKIF